MPLTADKAIELLKNAGSLIPAAAPYFSSKYQVLPFLNPRVADDLWIITTGTAATAGFVAYRLISAGAGATPSPRRNLLPIAAVVLALASLLVMISVIEGIMPAGSPAVEQVIVRATYVLLFTSLAAALGGALGLT